MLTSRHRDFWRLSWCLKHEKTQSWKDTALFIKLFKSLFGILELNENIAYVAIREKCSSKAQ